MAYSIKEKIEYSSFPRERLSTDGCLLQNSLCFSSSIALEALRLSGERFCLLISSLLLTSLKSYGILYLKMVEVSLA